MPGNSFGKVLTLTTFGESHGSMIGGILDGVPAGLELDLERIHQEMQRRRPGQSKVTTDRNETDQVELVSGILENTTLGTPIGILIRNKDERSSDYDHLKNVFRPSHADYTYQEKYGIRDHKGGGRSSARETAVRVAAGAIARQLIEKYCGLEVIAFVKSVGRIDMLADIVPDKVKREDVEKSIMRCPDPHTSAKMEAYVSELKEQGNSVGGIITCICTGVPTGLGEPVFDKLEADLGKGMLSINAVKGFEIGGGFWSSRMLGSEHNDSFVKEDDQIKTKTNHSEGVQGGISNGMNITFNVAFKPTATIRQAQETVNENGEKVILEASGRHDPCVVPRAVPIVEAMAALVLGDHLLRNRTSKMYP